MQKVAAKSVAMRTIALALSLTTVFGNSYYLNSTELTANAADETYVYQSSSDKNASEEEQNAAGSAEEEIPKVTNSIPKVSAKQQGIYSSKIVFKIKNIKNYSNTAKFEIYCGDKLLRTVSSRKVKKFGHVTLKSNGSRYFKPSEKYTFTIRAVSGDNKVCSASSPMIGKTGKSSYYRIKGGAKLYKLSNGKMKFTGKKSLQSYPKGKAALADGSAAAGRSVKSAVKYVRIVSGSNRGYYVKAGSAKITSEKEAKIQTVVRYAKGMHGGRYVWGGSRYRATDCSGLTMLAYKQIGLNITHNTVTQARRGRGVSVKNIQPGDVIICNGYGHAAMYIGGGKIVHAMSPAMGIKIQRMSALKYCGSINTVRRFI